jgi:hypothetical protein
VKVHGEAPKQYTVIETPKGVVDSGFIDDEMFNEVLEEVDSDSDELDSPAGISADFEEAVDEEEYDNIEESSDDDVEKE